MEAVVETGPQAIVFAPAGQVEEVMQNIRMIITTPKGSLALDRDFGLDHTIVDQPAPRAKALLSVEIVRQIAKYEPRARVIRIEWPEDVAGAMEGLVSCRVHIDVIEGER